MSVRFNLNDEVLIRMLPRGKQQFEKYYRDLGLDPAVYANHNLHGDGRLEMPIWMVMQIFGPVTYMGPAPAIEMEVEFA